MVHRNKGSPALNSSGTDFRTEAAGRPSNYDDNRKSTYAGRRSRRNSITEDSQLTIENFGGSQVRNNSVHQSLLKKIESIRVRLECYFIIYQLYFNYRKKEVVFHA